MKNFALIACLTLGLISCSNTGYEKKIPGSWCEPIPGRTQDVQEIKFQKDGKASSINMATLQYKSWKINGKTLILEGESTGNRQTLHFSDTLNIRQRPVDFKERSWLPNSLQKVQLRMKRTCSLNEQ